VVDKVEEEVAELRRAVDRESRERVEEEMGDLLFAIANLSRKLGVESESSLRKANGKFTQRFQRLEQLFESQGRSIHEASLEEMEEAWQGIKGG
jgi:DNA phosphorothioation-dependent restriction protein DptG